MLIQQNKKFIVSYFLVIPHMTNVYHFNAAIIRNLEPIYPPLLKSSPLFTFSSKLFGPDSPSVHLFPKQFGKDLKTAKIKLDGVDFK